MTQNNYFLDHFLTNVYIANCLFKITMKNAEMLHWYFISNIILPDFEQVTVLSEKGRVIHFHKSKQRIVLLWPYFYPFNPAYLFIKIFTDFGQVLFFKKGLKRKKIKQESFFYAEIFFQSMKKVSPPVFYRACTMVSPVYWVRHGGFPFLL